MYFHIAKKISKVPHHDILFFFVVVVHGVVVVVFVRRRRRLHDFTLLEKSDLFGRSTKKTKFKKFGKIYFTMLGREQVEEGLHLKPEASSSNPIIGNLKTNVA